MVWSSRVSVEPHSQELSSHFELLAFKLESVSSQLKLNIFQKFFKLHSGAQRTKKWRSRECSQCCFSTFLTM